MDSADAARPAHRTETDLAVIVLERSAEAAAGAVRIVRERPVLVVGIGAAVIGAALGSYLAGRMAAHRRRHAPWEPLLESAIEMAGDWSARRAGTPAAQALSSLQDSGHALSKGSSRLGHTARRAGYAAELAPLAVRLLANPIIRELLRDIARRRLARYFAGRF